MEIHPEQKARNSSMNEAQEIWARKSGQNSGQENSARSLSKKTGQESCARKTGQEIRARTLWVQIFIKSHQESCLAILKPDLRRKSWTNFFYFCGGACSC